WSSICFMRGSTRASASPEGALAMSVFVPSATARDDCGESRRSFLKSLLLFCRRQPLGTVGMVLVLAMALAGLSADWVAPYDPITNDFSAMSEAPSWSHWLGTDQFGRDILSRIIFGARTALIVGLSCAVIGGFAGLI